MIKTTSYAATILAIFFSACAVRSIRRNNQCPPNNGAQAAGQPSASVAAARKLKNPPVLSAGSGKELGDFKSGTHTITSAGLERKYTIDIPADYDKNKPYRLIFAMHMMGGHMDTMVNNKFYGLKTYAERDNVPCHFRRARGIHRPISRGGGVMIKTISSLQTCSLCSRIS